jgi:hypothetical protein
VVRYRGGSIVKETPTYFEQVPIKVVEKILVQQNTPAEQELEDAAVAAAPERSGAVRVKATPRRQASRAAATLTRSKKK